MSIGTLAITMARIKTAERESPISVFIRQDNVDGKTIRQLDARFANTIGAHHRKMDYIKARSSDRGQINHTFEWIGDYHKWNQVKTVRAILAQALVK